MATDRVLEGAEGSDVSVERSAPHIQTYRRRHRGKTYEAKFYVFDQALLHEIHEALLEQRKERWWHRNVSNRIIGNVGTLAVLLIAASALLLVGR